GVRAVPFPRGRREPAHQPGARSVRQDGRAEVLRGAHRAGRRSRPPVDPRPMDLGLAGRVALVCGSTKGLGPAAPQALAHAGARTLRSAVHLARAAVPIMRKRQWGRVICLASVAAKQPLPGLILSTTARAGVLGFAKALADEVAPEGITVNVICPGFIATERITELTETRAKQEHRGSQEVMRDLVAAIPLGRMGRT